MNDWLFIDGVISCVVISFITIWIIIIMLSSRRSTNDYINTQSQ